MPSPCHHSGTIASVIIAVLGLCFFTRKVARARAPGVGSQPLPPSSSSTTRVGGGGGRSAAKPAFGVGLLDIAIPRDDRQGGSFPRVLTNNACVARAVQEVSRKLVVSLRDTDSLPAGVVRAYVSELYQDVYDAACAAHRPDLDVRVLLPQSATTPTTPTGRYSTGRSASSPSAVGADVVNSAVWATRDAIQLEPDLEVVLSDEPGVNKSCQAALNVDRIRSGLPAIVVVSLESVARKAYNTDYFYAEDVLSEIPTFSSVACGGTFDRLHGGHKKLLTLAASMCPGGNVTVGVTSDSMLKKKANAEMVSSLPERVEGVKDFLRTLNPRMRMRVEEIKDPFGPPAVEEAFGAIAVSSETVSGAEKINELRAQKGFAPLAVVVTRRMAAATLSSSYLRLEAERRLEREISRREEAPATENLAEKEGWID